MASLAEKRRTMTEEETDTGANAEQRPEELRLMEALLFAAGEPLDEAALMRSLPDGVDVKDALARLKAEYSTRGVNLVKIGRKWTFRTADDLSWLLTKNVVDTRKLSRAAIETLAIVAYHQPVTRAEIEDIRGVALSRGTLDVLLEAGWIKPGKRRRTPGRPLTWMTTQEFLDHFGLEKLEDLPGLDELKASGLLDARPRVHVLQPGSSEPGEADEEGEGAEIEELEGLDDAIADEREDDATETLPRGQREK